jgi:hypothetical protein
MVLTAKPETLTRGEHDRLLREAVRVLLRNWHGHATVPSRSLYPHQWSWDSAFIALGLQHISVTRAATELLSLLRRAMGRWSSAPDRLQSSGA